MRIQQFLLPFCLLLVLLSACEIPTGIGASASKPFDQHNIKGKIK